MVFEKLIITNIVDIKTDGSIHLNMDYFSFTTHLKMIHQGKWEKLFGIQKRKSESDCC